LAGAILFQPERQPEPPERDLGPNLAIEIDSFGREIERGLPSFLSLASSLAGHASVITLLMMVRFPLSPPVVPVEEAISPTEIRIDKKLYYVARIEASDTRPAPVAAPKLVNPVAARAGTPLPPKPAPVATPPKPAAPRLKEAEQPVRQVVKRELARTFIPPEVKRKLNAEQTLIQPLSPPDLVPPPVALPTFRVMTPQLPRPSRKFVSPGQPTPRPPAQVPNMTPLPMELVSAMPAPSLNQPRLSLPRTPPPPEPPPAKAPEGPPPAPQGEPLNILSLSNRNTAATDRLIVPPGNIAPESTNGGADATPAGAQAANSATPATASPSPATATASATTVASSAAAGAGTIVGIRPAPEATNGRSTSGTGSGAAVSGATANGNPAVIVGGTSNGPASATPSSATNPGGGTGAAAATGTAPTNSAGNGGTGAGGAGTRIAPGQIVTRPAGTYDTVVVQSSPVDQYPESRGLLSGRPIYSVYVSVGSVRDWTLFFCIPNEKPAPNDSPVVQIGAPGIPVKAPYATKLMRPDLTLPSYQRYVLVHGFVTADGHFEGLGLVRSIRPETDKALLATLANWEFRPATRDGASVRVEFLLSIPARGL